MKFALIPLAMFSALVLAAYAREDSHKDAIRLGSGAHVYEWVSGWGKLPAGMEYGNTHGGIAVDSKGRVYVNTDSEAAVIVYDAEGKFVKAWGKDWAGGLHSMCLAKEGEREVLWMTHIGRHEVGKFTLEGELLRTIGWPEASKLYASANQYHPTAIAITPAGEIFVGDGYGLSWVHKYDKDGNYLKSFGGPGGEAGKLNCPHGLGMDLRGEKPLLIVCDRENQRLQRFDLDGKLVDVIQGELRRPCTVQQSGEHLVVADLAGRVTILGKDNKLVAHLGDQPDPAKRAQNGIAREQWKDGEFISPHSARWDAEGNLYVEDWLAQGRVSKLKRVK